MKRIGRFSIFVLVCALALALCGCASASGGIADAGENFFPGGFPPEEKPQEPDFPPETSDPEDPDGGGTDAPEPPGGGAEPRFAAYISSETDGLQVRSGAGAGYASLGSLDKGDMVAYLGETDEWFETVYKDRKAYVSKRYSALVELPKGSVAVEAVVGEGVRLLGFPYVWGAERYHWGNGKLNGNFKPGEFDCSSLMQYIFYKGADVLLDVNTRTQVFEGETVSEIRRGDVLFFTNDSRVDKTGVEKVGHVALYLGGDYILHTASDHAVIEKLSAKRKSYFLIAKRFL